MPDPGKLIQAQKRIHGDVSQRIQAYQKFNQLPIRFHASIISDEYLTFGIVLSIDLMFLEKNLFYALSIPPLISQQQPF